MNKINILFVDEAIEYGGSLVVLGNLVDALDKKRFYPVVVGEIDISLLRYYVKSNTQVYRIPRIYNYGHWSRTVNVLKRIPWQLPRKASGYLFSAIRSLLNTIYSIRIARIILKERVDIIHINNGMNNLAPVLVAVLLGRKFVVHIHGMENPGFIQKILIKKVPEFITISAYMMNGLVENGYPESRMTVVHNPVSSKQVTQEQTADLCKQYEINENNQVLGIVGRITRWKGHVEFLEAATIVMQAISGLKVLIVGSFPDDHSTYREEITGIVESSGYKERVIFTGFVKDVERYYSLMDVCVHSSIEPEPFGLVITEAMACGVPVIASDRGAPREIITDGDDGFIVKPESTEMLADTIMMLLNDDNLRDRVGARGKEHVLRDYSISAYARSMEQVYLNVLDGAV